MDKELKSYLRTVKITKSENTYKSYINELRHWFPNSDNVDLSYDYIAKRLDGFDCAHNVKVLRCSVLSGFITHYGYTHRLKDHEKIMNLLNSVHSKRTVPEVASHEQYTKIRSIIKEDWLRILVDLLYKNGLRISEACYIRTENFNPVDRTITILDTKNGNDYKIYLTKGLSSDIEAFIKSKPKKSMWLFDNKGKARNKTAVQDKIKAYCRAAGYENLSAHPFRHGSAVYMLENGLDVFKVKEHLHHKSIRSTERYLHMTPKQVEQVRNVFENA